LNSGKLQNNKRAFKQKGCSQGLFIAFHHMLYEYNTTFTSTNNHKAMEKYFAGFHYLHLQQSHTLS
jgi:hypothetical protein